MIVYIYHLRDPRDWRIRYVGRTYRPKKRLWQHTSKCDGNYHRHRWLKQLKDTGFAPKMEILEICAGNGCEEERKWIRKYRCEGIDLVNTKEGGCGSNQGQSFGNFHSEAWKEQHSKLMKGHKVSAMQRVLIRDSNKRFWSNPDVVAKHKEKTSAALAQYLISLSPEQKKLRNQKMSDNAKKLIPYKRTDEHISALSHRKAAEWKSMTEQDRETRRVVIQNSCSTPDEKKRRSLNAKKYWSSMTGEQREEMRRRISEGRKRE